MTAVEWFFRWVNDNPEATHKEYSEAFEQAKKMEKDNIIAFGYRCIGEVDSELGDLIYKKVPEEVYNETYGSKGSDEIEKSGKPILLYDTLKKIADFWHGSEIPKPIFKQYLSENNLDDIVTSSQTEISDEEINKIASFLEDDIERLSFKAGMKEYREQLKSK